MKPMPGYRGVEFGVHQLEDGRWEWAFYPKIGYGVAERGVEATREDAVSACKRAIDERLGPIAKAPWVE